MCHVIKDHIASRLPKWIAPNLRQMFTLFFVKLHVSTCRDHLIVVSQLLASQFYVFILRTLFFLYFILTCLLIYTNFYPYIHLLMLHIQGLFTNIIQAFVYFQYFDQNTFLVYNNIYILTCLQHILHIKLKHNVILYS